MNSDKSQSKMNKPNRYPTTLAMAAAILAYEKNNCQIVRITEDREGTRVISNRQLMGDILANLSELTETHQTQAEETISYLQQQGLMEILAQGKTNRFLGDINHLLSVPEVTAKDLGLIAWAPKTADDYKEKERVRELSACYESSSKYIGRLNDKIVINFTLIESRFINNLDLYAVYGRDEHNNLVFYWARDKKKIVTAGRLQGRVKSQQIEKRRGNARVTTLNYVKVL